MSGIIPAPMTGTPSFSAAEKPMNAARPATISPSLPAATSRTWRIQASAFSLAILAIAFVVAFRLFFPATTDEMLVTDWTVARKSPASAACGTPRSRALPNVPRLCQQSQFVTGIHQCATESCQRPGVALRAVSKCNELHLPPALLRSFGQRTDLFE